MESNHLRTIIAGYLGSKNFAEKAAWDFVAKGKPQFYSFVLLIQFMYLFHTLLT